MEVLLVILAIVIFIIAATGIKIVKPWEKGLIERLGKYQRTVDSGLSIIIPFMEIIKKVDMREQVHDVPPQGVISKDNVVVEVDAVGERGVLYDLYLSRPDLLDEAGTPGTIDAAEAQNGCRKRSRQQRSFPFEDAASTIVVGCGAGGLVDPLTVFLPEDARTGGQDHPVRALPGLTQS